MGAMRNGVVVESLRVRRGRHGRVNRAWRVEFGMKVGSRPDDLSNIGVRGGGGVVSTRGERFVSTGRRTDLLWAERGCHGEGDGLCTQVPS